MVAVPTMVRGTTSIGGGEAGALERFWERDVGEVGGASSEVGRVESPAPLEEVSPLAFKAWTSHSLLFLSILESTPRKQTEQRSGTS